MKTRIMFLSSSMLVLSLCGCMSSAAIYAAKPYAPTSPKKTAEAAGQSKPKTKINWPYYLLLPITLPLDIASSPCQLLLFGFGPRC
jgi:hypothetical protein